MNYMAFSENLIRLCLNFFRQTLDTTFFKLQETYFGLSAQWAAPLGAIIGLVIGICAAIKTDSFIYFIAGLGWVLIVCVGYYIGRQFCKSATKLIENNPSTISSTAFLDSFGLILILTLVGVIFGTIYASIKFSSITFLITGLSIAITITYYISLILNPELISTSVSDQSTAGEDALAIMVLFYKALVKLATIVFGSSLIVGSLLLLKSLFDLFSEDAFQVLAGGLQSLTGLLIISGGLIYPLAVSISFVFFYLIVDIIKAILTLHNRQSADGHGSHQNSHVAPTSNNDASVKISAETIKKSLIILALIAVSIGVIVKGNDYYKEYQERVEASRIEAAQKKALEDEANALAEQQRLAEESKKVKIQMFATNARKYVNKPAIDLVLDSQVNALFQNLFGNETTAFEGYFSASSAVIETEEILLGAGCIKDQCDQNKGLAIVNLKEGSVSAVLFVNGEPRYFGVNELDAPASVKKWVMSNRQ